MKLTVNEIKNKDDLITLRTLITSLQCNDPFNKIVVQNSSDENEKPHYFLFSKDDVPIVIMPFYLRSITINNKPTEYFDVSSPYGYSGPIFHPDLSSEYLIQFWNHIDVWYKEQNVITEFIRFNLNNNHKYYSGELIHTLTNVKGRIVDEKTQWENFKPKVRNNYRRATKENLKINIYTGNDINDDIIEAFYLIYTSTMNRNNAANQYFYSRSFFKDFIKLNSKNCAVALVYKDNVNISTELMLVSDKIIYSFLGGTLSEYFSSRPNDFLKIEVIKWAREKEIKHYVLGGGRSDGDGLYKYKKAFFQHDEDIIFYTGRKVIDSEIYKKLISEIETVGINIISNNSNEKYFPKYRNR
ncbi:GNAT family N-acetyltransferase [Flavobacteriaceae bacterium R38]|nr:GNAT family N-acetyltransferase [Flavobacteriaceae bacterium R38]